MSIWPKRTIWLLMWWSQKSPLTPEADNAKFKRDHLGTSVHSNCLFTDTTHVEDISPLQKSTWRAIKRSSWTYVDAHVGLLGLLAVYHDKEPANWFCLAQNKTHLYVSVSGRRSAQAGIISTSGLCGIEGLQHLYISGRKQSVSWFYVLGR